MSEQLMWKTLRPLIASLDPVRIEVKFSEGVPDVNYSVGWVELKYVGSWDLMKSGDRPRIAHFTEEQRQWLRRRWLAKGLAWLLIRSADDEWFLFDGGTAGLLVGLAPLHDLRTRCAAHWRGLPVPSELCEWLTGRPGDWADNLKMARLWANLDSFTADRNLRLPVGTVLRIEQGNQELYKQFEGQLRELYSQR